VVVGIVIVISLVVVGLVVSSADSVSGVSSASNKIGGLSQSVGVTESLVSRDGNFVVRLLNNSGELITVSNVKVGDSNVNFSEDLAHTGSKFFRVSLDINCDEGKVLSEDVVITFVTVDGLVKTERYPAKVMFDCSSYTINQANLANQCPAVYPGYYALGTGQTACYNNASDSSPCPVDGFPGQDAQIYGASFARVWVNNGCGTGTVLDESTGLCWQKADNDSDVNWQTALNYCNNLNLGNYSSGWRLPTIGEIWMMHDYNASSPSRYNVFSGGIIHWSSTSMPSYPGFAYDLGANGSIFNANKVLIKVRARCVRFEE